LFSGIKGKKSQLDAGTGTPQIALTESKNK
jgi:hypothetical protein